MEYLYRHRAWWSQLTSPKGGGQFVAFLPKRLCVVEYFHDCLGDPYLPHDRGGH